MERTTSQSSKTQIDSIASSTAIDKLLINCQLNWAAWKMNWDNKARNDIFDRALAPVIVNAIVTQITIEFLVVVVGLLCGAILISIQYPTNVSKDIFSNYN